MSATALATTGNTYGTRMGSDVVMHTYPFQFNTSGISSGIKLDTLKASAFYPVEVRVSCAIVTAFNAVTTNVVTAGTSSTATEWLGSAGITEGTAGYYPSNILKTYTVLGFNGAGAITVTGAQVGDIVSGVVGITAGTLGDLSAGFETTITVANQIQQSSATDYSAKGLLITLTRNSGNGRFRLTADTDIYVKYTQTGTAATTGSGILIVEEYSEQPKAIV